MEKPLAAPDRSTKSKLGNGWELAGFIVLQSANAMKLVLLTIQLFLAVPVPVPFVLRVPLLRLFIAILHVAYRM